MTAPVADVWLICPDDVSAVDERALRRVLSVEERTRADRFRASHLQRDFVSAHALVRWALTERDGGRAPEAWAFEDGPHGRPELAPGLSRGDVRFNLSHTRGLIAVAVVTGCRVGVDVELMTAETPVESLAETHFAPAERAWLGTLAAGARADGFFALWTLKESFIKALGLGLQAPLDGFWFELSGGCPRVGFDAARVPGAGPWTFVSDPIGHTHRLALAVGAASAVVRVRAITPADLRGRL